MGTAEGGGECGRSWHGEETMERGPWWGEGVGEGAFCWREQWGEGLRRRRGGGWAWVGGDRGGTWRVVPGALWASASTPAWAKQALPSQPAAPSRRRVTQRCLASTARPSTTTSSGSRCGSTPAPGRLRTCPTVSLPSAPFLLRLLPGPCCVTLGPLLNLSGPHLLCSGTRDTVNVELSGLRPVVYIR